MNDGNRFSDEQLQAFVDGQMTPEDRERLLAQLKSDGEGSARACEHLLVKEMLRNAYLDPPKPLCSRRRLAAQGSLLPYVAAVVLLVFGLAGGWQAQVLWGSPQGQGYEQLVRLDGHKRNERRVLLHIATADTVRVNAALNDAERLLKTFHQKSEPIQLEVVVNADGVRLLDARESPYAQRIRVMSSRFDNVSFLACSRAIQRMRLQGVDVHLMDEAKVVPEALETIVDRLQEGWVYIRA